MSTRIVDGHTIQEKVLRSTIECPLELSLPALLGKTNRQEVKIIGTNEITLNDLSGALKNIDGVEIDEVFEEKNECLISFGGSWRLITIINREDAVSLNLSYSNTY